jgi:hypothetical protein
VSDGFPGHYEERADMVERKIELKRRYHRKKKLAKLKKKLAVAKDGREKDAILKKIHVISPFWQEPAAQA